MLYEFKFDFLRIICSHEHYVQLNLPMMRKHVKNFKGELFYVVLFWLWYCDICLNVFEMICSCCIVKNKCLILRCCWQLSFLQSQVVDVYMYKFDVSVYKI